MARASSSPFDRSSWLAFTRLPGETLRAALARLLVQAMREGALRPGTRLPSSRRLAGELAVSRGVVTDVYEQLAAQGYLEVRSRRAPVVAAVTAPRPATVASSPRLEPAPRWDMTPTTPDVSLFPLRAWAAALRHAAATAPARALDYRDPRGDPGLRATLAEHLGRTRGVVADPDRIVVVQGTAQGLDLVLRVLAARGRRRVAVEDPSLEGLQRRLPAIGLETVPCPVAGDGARFAGVRADAALVTPAHQFPTGVVLGGAGRRELLAWARTRGRLVLEDDYDAEFRYDREPVRALQGLDPQRVVYFGTVSKTLAPALRLGWVVLPDDLVEDVAGAKLLADFCSPTLDQIALRDLFERGAYARHVRRAGATYRARRDALVAALARHLPGVAAEGVAAGLHALLRLPAGSDEAAVVREAARRGLRVEGVGRYALRPAAPALVLGYGPLHAEAIEPAIAVLGRAVAAAHPGGSV